MLIWLFFNGELTPERPEVPEVFRFQEVARQEGIDLVVDRSADWSAIYQGRELKRPHAIIARTGSETSYFTLAVLRHFERQGAMMVNGPAAVEAVGGKLHIMQILSESRPAGTCAQIWLSLNDYARTNDPFAQLGKAQVSVDVASVIRASENSFRVEWVERRYVDNALSSTERWSAILTTTLQIPTDADKLKKNPLGIYVHALNWSKELG